MESYTTYQTTIEGKQWLKKLNFYTYLGDDSKCEIRVKTPTINTIQVFRGISCEECKTNLEKMFHEATENF